MGLDNSPAMIDEARHLYPNLEFQLSDAHNFEFTEPFDGVFSNAALHWINDPAKVVACISRSLRPNGRMAVEFGGHGNVNFLSQAIETASESMTGERGRPPGTFPVLRSLATSLNNTGLKSFRLQ